MSIIIRKRVKNKPRKKEKSRHYIGDITHRDLWHLNIKWDLDLVNKTSS